MNKSGLKDWIKPVAIVTYLFLVLLLVWSSDSHFALLWGFILVILENVWIIVDVRRSYE